MKFSLTIIIGLFILIASGVFAQQSSLNSQFAKDIYLVNPAYAGLEGTLVASGHYRNQWLNFKGHPQTVLLACHFPIYKIKSGFGMMLGQDQVGLQSELFIRPSFNKVWKWNTWLVSTGIQFNLSSLGFNSVDSRTPDGEYSNGQIDHRDLVIYNEDLSKGLFDISLSVFVQKSIYKFGLNIDRILESEIKGTGLLYKNNRELKFIGLAHWEVQNFKIGGGSLLYTDLNRFQADFFTTFDNYGNIFGGLHLRGYNGESLESFGITAGFALTKKLQLAYTHEFYVGKLGKGLISGSQEMGLYYNLGKAFGLGKAPRIIHSPRYSD